MAFRKEFDIYKSKTVRVYINQCHNKGKKTNLYAIRRDDTTGCGRFLGTIKWDGAWRQYVTEFDSNTKWSSGCKKKICEFEDMINQKHRENSKPRKRKIQWSFDYLKLKKRRSQSTKTQKVKK